jgi:tight adherence protein B
MSGALVVAAAAIAVLACAGACRRPAARAVTRGGRWPTPDMVAAKPPGDAAGWAAALERVAAEVRTGASLPAAIAAVEPLPGGATRLTAGGGPLPGLAAGDDDAAYALHALGAAHNLGGPVAATLDNAAATLRERDAMRAEACAHSAPARLSAGVLTAVPLVFCAGNLATSPTFRAAWASSAGLVCAAVGAALNIVGWRWMRRTIRRASA